MGLLEHRAKHCVFKHAGKVYQKIVRRQELEESTAYRGLPSFDGDFLDAMRYLCLALIRADSLENKFQARLKMDTGRKPPKSFLNSAQKITKWFYTSFVKKSTSEFWKLFVKLF